MPEKEYLTLIGEGKSFVEDRKSRFIGRARHVGSEEEAYAYIDSIKRLEKGAAHNVYAFSIGRCSEIVRSSDDGEPFGTSGRPCLEAMKTKELTDCVTVVTRYFGGTLLGTGGLARAYGQAAREALSAAGIAASVLYAGHRISLEYGDWGRVSNFLSKRKLEEFSVDFLTKVEISFLVRDSIREELDKGLIDLLSGKIEIENSGKKELLIKLSD